MLSTGANNTGSLCQTTGRQFLIYYTRYLKNIEINSQRQKYIIILRTSSIKLFHGSYDQFLSGVGGYQLLIVREP